MSCLSRWRTHARAPPAGIRAACAHDTYLGLWVMGERVRQLAREGALADAAFAREHKHLVAHIGQPLRNLRHIYATGVAFTVLSSRNKAAPYTCHTRALGCVPGSGPLGAVAQTFWLGQPAHASALPACSLAVPGQSENGQR